MSGSPLAGLWFDIFKHEPGMPHYDAARWFQIEAAHFVDPHTGDALVGEREAVRALLVLARGLRDKCAEQRRQGLTPCDTQRVSID